LENKQIYNFSKCVILSCVLKAGKCSQNLEEEEGAGRIGCIMNMVHKIMFQTSLILKISKEIFPCSPHKIMGKHS
jgi:hypothetical protein